MDTIEGHAQHVCADGHEECAVTAGGLCGRPFADYPDPIEAEAAMFNQVGAMGHREHMRKVHKSPLGSPPGTMVLIWECTCGLRAGLLHAWQSMLHPERGSCWRIEGSALRQQHQPPLRRVREDPRPDEFPHNGGT